MVVDVAVAELDRSHDRIGGRFVRSEPRGRAREYMLGLTAGLERKNGWTPAERAGEASPDGMQRLSRRADRDVDGVRDDLQVDGLHHSPARLSVGCRRGHQVRLRIMGTPTEHTLLLPARHRSSGCRSPLPTWNSQPHFRLRSPSHASCPGPCTTISHRLAPCCGCGLVRGVARPVRQEGERWCCASASTSTACGPERCDAVRLCYRQPITPAADHPGAPAGGRGGTGRQDRSPAGHHVGVRRQGTS